MRDRAGIHLAGIMGHRSYGASRFSRRAKAGAVRWHSNPSRPDRLDGDQYR